VCYGACITEQIDDACPDIPMYSGPTNATTACRCDPNSWYLNCGCHAWQSHWSIEDGVCSPVTECTHTMDQWYYLRERQSKICDIRTV
jgi:hypothetical protein